MSQSASQASIFYSDVAKKGKVWTLRDKNGFPAPIGDNNKRTMPFWSSSSRVEKIIRVIPTYSNFSVVEIDLDTFMKKWLLGLENDRVLVGINWSGTKVTGYDVHPKIVMKSIEFQLQK